MSAPATGLLSITVSSAGLEAIGIAVTPVPPGQTGRVWTYSYPPLGFTAQIEITLNPGQSYVANGVVPGGTGLSAGATPSSFQCVPNSTVSVDFFTTGTPTLPSLPPINYSALPPGTVTLHVVDAGIPNVVIASPDGREVLSVSNPAQGLVETANIFLLPGIADGPYAVLAYPTGYVSPGTFSNFPGVNVDVYAYSSPVAPSIPVPTAPPPPGQPLIPPPPPVPPTPDLPVNPAIAITGCSQIIDSGNLNFYIQDNGVTGISLVSYLNGVNNGHINIFGGNAGDVRSSDPFYLISCTTYGATCGGPSGSTGYCYPAFFQAIPSQTVDVLVKLSPFAGTVTGIILDNGIQAGGVGNSVGSVLTVRGLAGASGVATTYVEGSPYFSRCVQNSGAPGFSFPETFSCIPDGNVNVYFSSTPFTGPGGAFFPSGVVLPSGITILEQLTGDQFSAIRSNGATGFIGLSTAGPVGEPAWPKYCAFSTETGPPPAYQIATAGSSGYSYSAPSPTSPVNLVQAAPVLPYVAGSYNLRFSATFQEGALASGVYTRLYTTWPYNATTEWGIIVWFSSGFTSAPTDVPYVEFNFQWGRMFY